MTSQADDADSWLRDGLGQTPLLTSKLWFTGHQRHTAQHGDTHVLGGTHIPKHYQNAHLHTITYRHTEGFGHRLNGLLTTAGTNIFRIMK